jgi:hypothetical protein
MTVSRFARRIVAFWIFASAFIGCAAPESLSRALGLVSAPEPWGDNGVLARFVAVNPIPRPYSQGGTDEDRRAWARKCAEQFAFSFPGQGWGHKSAHSALVPASTDSIARQAGGRLYAYDLILAGGADNQRVDLTPDELDITGQYFIPVTPKDHTGAGGGGGGSPGPKMRLGASLFWGLGAERHGWPELDQQLREYQAHGVDFVRTLVHLNSSDPHNPWKRIGLHAEDPDLDGVIQRYLDRVARHGMKVELTLLGGMADMTRGDQQDRFADRISNAVRGRLDKIEFIEVMNEYRVNGADIPVLHRIAKRLVANLGTSFLLALSSPDAAHNGGNIPLEVQTMALHEATVATPHWDRFLNQPPNLGPYAPDFVVCNEPRGPSSSVAETDNPADIEHDWRAAEAAGYYAYVLHSDSGVWSTYITDEWKDGTRGIWPVFSTHRNGIAILETVKRLRGSVGSGGGGPPPSGGPFTGGPTLRAGQVLRPGQRMVADGGSHYFEYQADGNMVVRRADGHPIWSSKASHAPGYVAMQTDGHFVEYDASNTPRRATHTWGKGGVSMTMQPDGHLLMRTADGTPIWGSFNDDIYGEDGEPVR